MDTPNTAHPSPRALERPALTERRKQILKFCHQYAQCHGWAASIEEIAQEMKISHFSAENDLRTLDELDYVIFQGSRQIKVLMLP